MAILLAVLVSIFLPACSTPLSAQPAAGTIALQAELNRAYAAGGGTVTIPRGNYILGSSLVVRDNVSLVGAGAGRTIIHTSSTNQVIRVQGDNSRVSGFSLVGRDFQSSTGIAVLDSVDFRIDHVTVDGYSYAGVSVEGQRTRGVIDHSMIRMKMVPGFGYGVLVLRDNYWEEDMKLGSAEAVFIEDCVLLNARHAVAANAGAHYVFRHNLVKNGTDHQVDAHGIGFGSREATRAIEVYENVIDDPFTSEGAAIGIRGGGGVIFNNTIGGYPIAVILQVESGQVGSDYPVPGQVHDLWIWDNLDDSPAPEVVVAYSPDSRDLIREGRDFFTHPPDGYVPYVYPHPLAAGR